MQGKLRTNSDCVYLPFFSAKLFTFRNCEKPVFGIWCSNAHVELLFYMNNDCDKMLFHAASLIQSCKPSGEQPSPGHDIKKGSNSQDNLHINHVVIFLPSLLQCLIWCRMRKEENLSAQDVHLLATVGLLQEDWITLWFMMCNLFSRQRCSHHWHWVSCLIGMASALHLQYDVLK